MRTHGPHQVAKKSTRTGFGDERTRPSNSAVSLMVRMIVRFLLALEKMRGLRGR